MSEQVEPIAMPPMPEYKPRVNVGPDDPDTYMMLVPAANINTKLPILQTVFTVLAVIFAICALSIDEISDGDIIYNNVSKPEVDYDCGWKEFRLSVGGYSEHYHYAGEYCDQNDQIIDQDFCNDSIKNGKVWICCGIIGIFLLCGSVYVIYSSKEKDNLRYAALLLSGSICFCIGSFWWWSNDRCEDVEQYDEEYVEANFDTSPGKSMYLMWTAVAMTFAALLITALHLSNKYYHHHSQRKREQNVPRIQSHHVVH